MLGLSQEFLKRLPPATVEWRLSRWLSVGSTLMRALYKDITTPTLVLVGAQDRMLPSASEGFRLEKVLLNAAVEVREFRDGGHAILDDTMDLNAVLQASKTLGPPPVPLPIDIPFPSQRDIDEAEQTIFGGFVKAFSPVFLHRDAQGRLQRGIQDIPVGTAGRPVLLIGNHQLYGLDTGLIIREFLQQRNTLVRGLAHPILFNAMMNPSEIGGAAGQAMFSRNNVVKFGGVEVSPGSIFELMKRNETILLFPGGANEACHGKDEAYTLKWNSNTDFVRMAAAFDAIIVPFGAIGIADSVNMLMDGEDISNNPILSYSAQRYVSFLVFASYHPFIQCI